MESEAVHSVEDHDDFGGISRDLPRLIGRRRALWLVGGGLGAAALIGCGSSVSRSVASTTSTSVGTNSTSSIAPSSSCTKPPSETAGPFPGDGTNGPDVLTQSGVVRQDITSSFGSMAGVAGGVPLRLRLKMLDISNGCSPYAGAAMYVWHSTRDGGYSLYSNGVKDQNFLRGVQAADGEGWITFDTIFPGCYDGRWPHIHFEVFPNLSKATKSSNKVLTSQLAMPKDACDMVFATSGYESSVANFKRTSLQNDMVFRDGWVAQLPTVTGDVATGLVAQINIPV